MSITQSDAISREEIVSMFTPDMQRYVRKCSNPLDIGEILVNIAMDWKVRMVFVQETDEDGDIEVDSYFCASDIAKAIGYEGPNQIGKWTKQFEDEPDTYYTRYSSIGRYTPPDVQEDDESEEGLHAYSSHPNRVTNVDDLVDDTIMHPNRVLNDSGVIPLKVRHNGDDESDDEVMPIKNRRNGDDESDESVCAPNRGLNGEADNQGNIDITLCLNGKRVPHPHTIFLTEKGLRHVLIHSNKVESKHYTLLLDNMASAIQKISKRIAKITNKLERARLTMQNDLEREQHLRELAKRDETISSLKQAKDQEAIKAKRAVVALKAFQNIQDVKPGYIYIAVSKDVNKRMIVKIGETKDIVKRQVNYGTSQCFKITHTTAYCLNVHAVEAHIKKCIPQLKVYSNRELYWCSDLSRLIQVIDNLVSDVNELHEYGTKETDMLRDMYTNDLSLSMPLAEVNLEALYPNRAAQLDV
jgi:Skp family chaperone for outer membrane proteins